MKHLAVSFMFQIGFRWIVISISHQLFPFWNVKVADEMPSNLSWKSQVANRQEKRSILHIIDGRNRSNKSLLIPIRRNIIHSQHQQVLACPTILSNRQW